MKLLYVTNTRFPSERAHAVQIAHMCQAFAQAGAAVTLIANNRQEEDVSRWIGFIPLFKVLRVRFGLWFVPYSKLFFVINNLVFVSFVIPKVTLTTFDVVYVRDEWIGWLLLWFVSPARLVYESHEAKYNFPARRLFKKGVKCVCISQGIKRLYQEKGIAEEKLLVADDGIDEHFFGPLVTKAEAQASLGLKSPKQTIMYIGGLERWKGIDTFCEAAALLPQLQFVAIGGTTEQVVSQQNTYPDVMFVGQRPYKDLPTNQQAADVLVVPNTATSKLSSEYTSPLKLFAHMTSKKPLIISNIPSLTRILSPAHATTFEAGDSRSLAKAITEVCSNYSVAEAKAALTHTLSQEYTWKKRAEKIKVFLGYTKD